MARPLTAAAERLAEPPRAPRPRSAGGGTPSKANGPKGPEARPATATGSATGSRAIFSLFRARGMSESPATFVLVHGVARRLVLCARRGIAAGTRPYRVHADAHRPRGSAHLFSGAINSTTHVEDVLGVFRFERLRDVVLAGHSYGGMVITASPTASRSGSRRSPISMRSFPRTAVAVRHQHSGQYPAVSRECRPHRGLERSLSGGPVSA